MKKIVPFIICFILQIFIGDLCMAQSQYKIDSLTNVLKNAKDDSAKVDTYLSLADLVMNNNVQAFFNCVKQSLALSDKLNFDKGKVRSLHAIAAYFYITSNYDSSLMYLNTALKIIEKTGDKKGLLDSYSNLATIYSITGNYQLEYDDYLKALNIAQELKDTSKMGAIYGNIGLYFDERSDYENSIKFQLESLKWREATKDSVGIANSLMLIGNVFLDEKNYEKALDYQLRSLQVSESIADLRDASRSYFLIATMYGEQMKYEDALMYWQKTLKINEQLTDEQAIADAYSGMGKIYFYQHNLDLALSTQSSSLKINNSIGDKTGTANNYLLIGDIYSEKKDFILALDNYKKSLPLFKEMGSREFLSDNYESLSKTYSALGNYKLAYDNYVLYAQLKDSIFNDESSKKITEMEGKFNTVKKDNEIALLTKDKEIQNTEIKRQKLIKNYFIAGVIALLLLFILFYNYYRTKQLLRLQTLRNRIASDLHDDVGSTLSSISIFSELAKEQSKEVIPMLESIGDSSRKMLESMADIVWTINPENDNFEKIILRMRSFAFELLGAKKIDFEFNADDTVAKMKLPMDVRKNLYLIFKEAINNMVKYADADRAYFSISREKNNLAMLIRDNGKGFDAAISSQGNGLNNMKKRAAEVGAKLLIESGTGIGTTIQFFLKIV